MKKWMNVYVDPNDLIYANAKGGVFCRFYDTREEAVKAVPKDLASNVKYIDTVEVNVPRKVTKWIAYSTKSDWVSNQCDNELTIKNAFIDYEHIQFMEIEYEI